MIPHPQPYQNVVVRDIEMSFGSMIVFMLKWALAAIPAVLILVVIGAVFSAIFAGFVAGIIRH